MKPVAICLPVDDVVRAATSILDPSIDSVDAPSQSEAEATLAAWSESLPRPIAEMGPVPNC